MTSMDEAHVLSALESKNPAKSDLVLLISIFPIISNMEYERSDSTKSVHHFLTSTPSHEWLQQFFLNNSQLRVPDAFLQMDEEDETEEEHVDKYNCRCRECRTKFGSLPLLVDVIEQNIEQKTDEPQPSTSSQSAPKSIQCKHCSKEFTHKGDFNKHQRKHTGEQPFKCKVCGRRFSHTSNLTRHTRLHSGDKPFACDKCGKKFTRKDKLEAHRKGKSCGRQ